MFPKKELKETWYTLLSETIGQDLQRQQHVDRIVYDIFLTPRVYRAK